ncbi:MAG: biotin transporter BioY [Proteobacteria bacterium SG_bin9]|nr:MAG: biotin transporter BioY [Proteobacteria bacterium SG_bin9]
MRAFARNAILVVAGTALLALSAKVNVPLPYVPMTMQTLVVLMIGAGYGSRLGFVTLLAYIAEGAMGLPVFASPVGGLAILAGPTGGYLVGFAVAAFVTGWMCEHGFGRSALRVFIAMAVGHLIIFAFGFAWLAYGVKLGAERAWLVGVVPFVAGSVVKNALGTVLMAVLSRWAQRIRAA